MAAIFCAGISSLTDLFCTVIFARYSFHIVDRILKDSAAIPRLGALIAELKNSFFAFLLPHLLCSLCMTPPSTSLVVEILPPLMKLAAAIDALNVRLHECELGDCTGTALHSHSSLSSTYSASSKSGKGGGGGSNAPNKHNGTFSKTAGGSSALSPTFQLAPLPTPSSQMTPEDLKGKPDFGSTWPLASSSQSSGSSGSQKSKLLSSTRGHPEAGYEHGWMMDLEVSLFFLASKFVSVLIEGGSIQPLEEQYDAVLGSAFLRGGLEEEFAPTLAYANEKSKLSSSARSTTSSLTDTDGSQHGNSTGSSDSVPAVGKKPRSRSANRATANKRKAGRERGHSAGVSRKQPSSTQLSPPQEQQATVGGGGGSAVLETVLPSSAIHGDEAMLMQVLEWESQAVYTNRAVDDEGPAGLQGGSGSTSGAYLSTESHIKGGSFRPGPPQQHKGDASSVGGGGGSGSMPDLKPLAGRRLSGGAGVSLKSLTSVVSGGSEGQLLPFLEELAEGKGAAMQLDRWMSTFLSDSATVSSGGSQDRRSQGSPHVKAWVHTYTRSYGPSALVDTQKVNPAMMEKLEAARRAIVATILLLNGYTSEAMNHARVSTANMTERDRAAEIGFSTKTANPPAALLAIWKVAHKAKQHFTHRLALALQKEKSASTLNSGRGGSPNTDSCLAHAAILDHVVSNCRFLWRIVPTCSIHLHAAEAPSDDFSEQLHELSKMFPQDAIHGMVESVSQWKGHAEKFHVQTRDAQHSTGGGGGPNLTRQGAFGSSSASASSSMPGGMHTRPSTSGTSSSSSSCATLDELLLFLEARVDSSKLRNLLLLRSRRAKIRVTGVSIIHHLVATASFTNVQAHLLRYLPFTVTRSNMRHLKQDITGRTYVAGGSERGNTSLPSSLFTSHSQDKAGDRFSDVEDKTKPEDTTAMDVGAGAGVGLESAASNFQRSAEAVGHGGSRSPAISAAARGGDSCETPLRSFESSAALPGDGERDASSMLRRRQGGTTAESGRHFLENLNGCAPPLASLVHRSFHHLYMYLTTLLLQEHQQQAANRSDSAAATATSVDALHTPAGELSQANLHSQDILSAVLQSWALRLCVGSGPRMPSSSSRGTGGGSSDVGILTPGSGGRPPPQHFCGIDADTRLVNKSNIIGLLGHLLSSDMADVLTIFKECESLVVISGLDFMENFVGVLPSFDQFANLKIPYSYAGTWSDQLAQLTNTAPNASIQQQGPPQQRQGGAGTGIGVDEGSSMSAAAVGVSGDSNARDVAMASSGMLPVLPSSTTMSIGGGADAGSKKFGDQDFSTDCAHLAVIISKSVRRTVLHQVAWRLLKHLCLQLCSEEAELGTSSALQKDSSSSHFPLPDESEGATGNSTASSASSSRPSSVAGGNIPFGGPSPGPDVIMAGASGNALSVATGASSSQDGIASTFRVLFDELTRLQTHMEIAQGQEREANALYARTASEYLFSGSPLIVAKNVPTNVFAEVPSIPSCNAANAALSAPPPKGGLGSLFNTAMPASAGPASFSLSFWIWLSSAGEAFTFPGGGGGGSSSDAEDGMSVEEIPLDGEDLEAAAAALGDLETSGDQGRPGGARRTEGPGVPSGDRPSSSERGAASASSFLFKGGDSKSCRRTLVLVRKNDSVNGELNHCFPAVSLLAPNAAGERHKGRYLECFMYGETLPPETDEGGLEGDNARKEGTEPLVCFGLKSDKMLSLSSWTHVVCSLEVDSTGLDTNGAPAKARFSMYINNRKSSEHVLTAEERKFVSEAPVSEPGPLYSARCIPSFIPRHVVLHPLYTSRYIFICCIPSTPSNDIRYNPSVITLPL
jgi:hypothetical protein